MFLLTVIGPFVWALDKSFGLPKGVLAQFDHAWGGFTLWDIIMPLFIFMSGAAVPFAMKGRLDDGHARWRYWRHVLSRFAVLWILGMVAQGRLLTLDANLISPFDNTLQSIAVGYLACALVYRIPSRAVRFAVPAALALFYTLVLAFLGDYSKGGNAAELFENWFVPFTVPATSRVLELADPGYTWWATIPMFAAMGLAGMCATEILTDAALAPTRPDQAHLHAFLHRAGDGLELPLARGALCALRHPPCRFGGGGKGDCAARPLRPHLAACLSLRRRVHTRVHGVWQDVLTRFRPPLRRMGGTARRLACVYPAARRSPEDPLRCAAFASRKVRVMKLNSIVLLAFFAAVIAPGGWAATNEVAELPNVVVTASPVTQEERVSADGVETVVVSRRQLDALNAGDIQTALRQVPGVTVSRYAPVGSYGGAQGGSVYVRGFGTARPGGEIRMYMDGAPRESGVWSHPLMRAAAPRRGSRARRCSPVAAAALSSPLPRRA